MVIPATLLKGSVENAERGREKIQDSAKSPMTSRLLQSQHHRDAHLLRPAFLSENGPAPGRMRLCAVSDGDAAVIYRRQEALRFPGG